MSRPSVSTSEVWEGLQFTVECRAREETEADSEKCIQGCGVQSTNCGPKEKRETDPGVGTQIHGDSQIRAEAVDNGEDES